METKTISFRDTIILAMSEEMRRDENVFLMGEDVGVFGGDFGTSVGMLEEFGPERVRDCPISEAAISGAAAGAAMTGLRPIVDMTFMDFSVIAMDNIVNQAAKTRYMFGGKGQVPMTVRCAAGNGVGSAAQHSQSLESWFTHIPGLKVVAPGTPADMKGLLKSSIRDNNPVIILEYKSEFNQKGEVPVDPDYTIPLGVGEIKREGTDVTVVTYGKMLRRVVQANVIQQAHFQNLIIGGLLPDEIKVNKGDLMSLKDIVDSFCIMYAAANNRLEHSKAYEFMKDKTVFFIGKLLTDDLKNGDEISYMGIERESADGTSYEAVKCFLTKESAEQYNDSKKPVSPANLAYLQAFWGKPVIIEPHRNYWIEFK